MLISRALKVPFGYLLLAERASNQEIAARLFLSPHTVRHHAERIFAKLGITSRREVRTKLHA
jgi:DNA-binding CsgD family transcriptional regulator